MKKAICFLLSAMCVALLASCGGKTYTITVDDADYMEYLNVHIYELDKYEKIQNEHILFRKETQSEEYTACPETVELVVQANGPVPDGYGLLSGINLPLVNIKFKLRSGKNNIHISMKDNNHLDRIVEAWEK